MVKLTKFMFTGVWKMAGNNWLNAMYEAKNKRNKIILLF